ncbi:hypothetical protein LAZ29_01975 [Cereibacter sphaeroides]|uniref:hypothetical protein n=2 Tax=Alphaproteobacteria TaxID=28211 RepID=UPI001F39E3EA|nr:hypothetical protein [Cereibacter sphaeroides]MCE6949696.1 hypothetical protein [Cereibacter sphaeroides]
MRKANLLRTTTATMALAGVMALAPWSVSFDAGRGLVSVKAAVALAKDGDDRGGSGRGGDDDRGDDHGGSGRGGDDDDRGDDHGGSGRGGDDDDRGDDHGGSGRGGDDDDHDDDHGGSRGRGGSESDDDNARGPRSDDDAHEATLPDGSRIEIENGRFEMKNPAGRTIVERPATAADLELLAQARQGLTPASARKPQAAPVRRGTGGGGVVAKLEVSGANIEVTYTDGWREEIENGRYELKDDLNRTVIERPARRADRKRLMSAMN